MTILRGFKRAVVGAVRFINPSVATCIESALQRMHIRRFERSIGLDRLVERFVHGNECVVLDGPFNGMRYISKSSGSALLPKLLGSYEQELNSVIVEAISRTPKLVLDVGCAEGYYAVGIARRLPNALLLGYDIDSHAKASCSELAKKNNAAERVQVHGRCDHAELVRRIVPSTLLICDCEGFEWQFLDVNRVPALASCDMIVELHSKSDDDCKREMESRFGDTHVLQFIAAKPRSNEVTVSIQDWSLSDQALARNEFRTDGQLWVWAMAKSQ